MILTAYDSSQPVCLRQEMLEILFAQLLEGRRDHILAVHVPRRDCGRSLYLVNAHLIYFFNILFATVWHLVWHIWQLSKHPI